MRKIIKLDFDNVGDYIDFHLYNNNLALAQEATFIIQSIIKTSLNFIKENFTNVEILVVGADDILFSCQELTKEKLNILKNFYSSQTPFTISIGVGDDIKESLLNLRIAKVSGKNMFVGF